MRQFELQDPLRDEFDDDLPASPAGGTAVEDAGGDAAMFDGVAKKGDLFPVGTFHFRIARITNEGTHLMYEDKEKTKVKKYSDGVDIDAQPYFQALLSCQQEPHTGKGFTVFIGWPSKTMREKAAAGDASAKRELQNRLVEAKAIMEASGYKPAGAFDFKKDFLATNPEFKAQVGIRKGRAGGEDQNNVVKYFPLQRPS